MLHYVDVSNAVKMILIITEIHPLKTGDSGENEKIMEKGEYQ
jgi:hypothetical protein